ncbi:IS66 family transposase [Actinocrinis sp.]|uniref:IS66 family transposase n=1 Tax=Actinocrinis sp. TaxID=1920516 RepID=UPI0039C88A4F
MTLTARHRVSRRGICELARDLFGVTLSTGAVDAICQRASDALAGPHCQLQDWVLDQGAVHVDETGWRTRGEGRALWTASTPGATFLQIAGDCPLFCVWDRGDCCHVSRGFGLRSGS